MKSSTGRKNIVGGTMVSRFLIRCLREMRETGGGMQSPEEIEFWEDHIRAIVKNRRREPRAVLELDSATVVALDEAFPDDGRHYSMKDFIAGIRRDFAQRIIRAGCVALVCDPDQRQFALQPSFVVDLRELTDEERQIERLLSNDWKTGG